MAYCECIDNDIVCFAVRYFLCKERTCVLMITKEMLKKTFLEICEKADIKEDVIVYYENMIVKELEAKGILFDSDEAKRKYWRY